MKIILSIAFTFLLCACSAGWNHANQNDGGYVWVGCHIIHTNPQDCYPTPDKCAYAFGLQGDLEIGQKIYFKQADDKYGTVGMPITARPCKEGE